MQSLETVENSEAVDHQALEVAAYYLWEKRGCPVGSPEVDWFRAEEELAQVPAERHTEPAVVGMAATVGSAIGSVAGFVETLAHLVHPVTPDE